MGYISLQIKSFHAELLIPLETKQENEFKQITVCMTLEHFKVIYSVERLFIVNAICC